MICVGAQLYSVMVSGLNFIGYSCSYFSDINECDIDNGGCEHNCTNVIYTFECSCQLGYNLTEDGFNCNGRPAFINVVCNTLNFTLH